MFWEEGRSLAEFRTAGQGHGETAEGALCFHESRLQPGSVYLEKKAQLLPAGP